MADTSVPGEEGNRLEAIVSSCCDDNSATTGSGGEYDIDLYAEDLCLNHELEGGADSLFHVPDDTADAIASSKKFKLRGSGIPGGDNSPATAENRSSSQTSQESKVKIGNDKWQLCVGGLTWWTTDKMLQDSFILLGVTDLKEIKFFENKQNGQSKGYAVITVNSEASHGKIMSGLPKMVIEGRKPIVTLFNRMTLAQFDGQYKTRPVPTSNLQGNNGQPPMRMNGPRGPCGGPPMHPNGMVGPMISSPRGGGMMSSPVLGPMRGAVRGPPIRNHPNGVARGFGSPLQQQRPRAMPRPPMPGMPPSQLRMQPCHPQPPMLPRHPRPMMDGSRMGPMDWNRPPLHPINDFSHGPIHPPGAFIGGSPFPPALHGNGAMMPIPPGMPQPHLNPAFFSPTGEMPSPTPPMKNIGSPLPAIPGFESSPNPPSGATNMSLRQKEAHFPSPARSSALTEDEKEEIMSRNRAVSSSAILRAVTDTANGEFASAIETLVTAISLIKQSKVAKEDACKAVIGALHDTLEGIEQRSYGRSERRSPSRERRSLRAHHHRIRRDRSPSKDLFDEVRSSLARSSYDFGHGGSGSNRGDRSRSKSPTEREFRERDREVRDRHGRSSGRDREDSHHHHYRSSRHY